MSCSWDHRIFQFCGLCSSVVHGPSLNNAHLRLLHARCFPFWFSTDPSPLSHITRSTVLCITNPAKDQKWKFKVQFLLKHVGRFFHTIKKKTDDRDYFYLVMGATASPLHFGGIVVVSFGYSWTKPLSTLFLLVLCSHFNWSYFEKVLCSQRLASCLLCNRDDFELLIPLSLLL